MSFENQQKGRPNRREFLKTGGSLLAGSGFCAAGTALSSVAVAGTPATPNPIGYNDRVGDRIWVWCHAEGAYDNTGYKLPGKSKVTPIEGAKELGASNVIMVRYHGRPAPPYEDRFQTLADRKRIYWSFIGANGKTSLQEQNQVLELAARHPQIVGLFMDDFFRGNADLLKKSAKKNGQPAASCSLENLVRLREKLQIGNRKLDLGVTLYTMQLTPEIKPHLDLCDVVSFWTWTAPDLKKLEHNFEFYQKIVPGKRTLLGIYMWDFGLKCPMTIAQMEHQCGMGLRWLREGRIEGMIFLGSNICGLGIEAVEWSKKWIATHREDVI